MAMEKRDFGRRSGFRIPRGNIGAMRLPQDEDEAVALIRHALDSGMTYIDTSRGYGDSEILVGKALKDGYRDKAILSTKWSPWIVKIDPSDDASADCTRRRIEESMRRLDVDRLDFYQVWNIMRPEHWEQATAPGGMVEGILKAKDEGLIDHVGFTTHDAPENVLRYIEEADWCEILLMSYNMLYVRYAPVFEAAHRKGIGTIVMNPVGGGRLTGTVQPLDDLVREAGATSAADLAIRFVMSNPNIDTILSGITRLSDVDDTIASVRAGGLDEGALDGVRGFVQDHAPADGAICNQCLYCWPCPEGINIPAFMTCVQDERIFGLSEVAQRQYEKIGSKKPDACAQCGECESKCPQKLPIMEDLAYALDRFGKK